MRLRTLCLSGKVKVAFSVMAFSLFLCLFAGSLSANTTSGTVMLSGAPVTDVTVYLINDNTNVVMGSCHTNQFGYFSITTSTNDPCQIIAIPDNIDAVYYPTYFPNQIDSRRGFVIYPADNPGDLIINPVTEGEAAVTGLPVKVSGHINHINVSGVPASVFLMCGDQVLSCQRVNLDGTFSFTHKMNSSCSLKITNLGYNTVDLSYNNLNVVNEGDLASCNLNVDMIISGNGSVVTPSSMERLNLSQNYPNPFNPTTNISFSVPNSGLVKVLVYDLSGRMVSQLVNEYKNAGTYSVTFNASALSSGIYYYSIENGNSKITKQMMLIK